MIPILTNQETATVPDLATEFQYTSWQPSIYRTPERIARIKVELDKLMPTNAKLVSFAKQHTPPQSWFDDESDPFMPEDSEST